MNLAWAIFNFIEGLLVFAALLFLAYAATRYIGKKTGNAMKGKYITVIESISLGMDKNIHLLKVGEQFVLIASTGRNIEFLTNVSIDDYQVDPVSDSNSTFDFKQFFDKYLQNFKNGSRTKESNRTADTGDISKEYSFKTNLDKLRSLNTRVGKHEIEDGVETKDE